MSTAPMQAFEIGELFAQSVRRTLPLLAERKLACAFDCRGPRAVVLADPTALRCSLHRLICGLIEVLDIGFAVLHAQTQLVRPARCLVSIKIAGVGLAAPAKRMDDVLERLHLVDEHLAEGPDRPRLRRAEGMCPATGAAIRFASLPAEGVLFAIEWGLALDASAFFEAVDARQSRAWIIHDDDVACESLARRLARLGWAASRFDGPTAALRRLRALPDLAARPSLVIACECATVSPGAVQPLRPFLPTGTTTVYCTAYGSPTLANTDPVHGFDVKTLPFSAGDLEAITASTSCDTDHVSAASAPAALTHSEEGLALVCVRDEGDTAYICALLDGLGYRTRAAGNRRETVDMSRHLQPEVVLLEADAGDRDSLDTLRSLRSLQAAGEAVPAVLLALTRDDSPRHRNAALAAGADAQLSRPVDFPTLRSELQRLCALTPAEASRSS